MKVSHYLLTPLVIFLCSCSPKYYYQICDVSSDLKKGYDNAYTFENEQLKISYNFWSNGGSIKFNLTNLSNEMIVLDLSKSFCIKNSIAQDYYQNRIQYTSNAFSFIELAASTSSSIAYIEPKVIAIPPHSSRIIKEFKFLNSHYQDCDLYESPSKDEESYLTFNTTSSPLIIDNFITYTIGNDSTEHIIENRFYVSRISNQHHDATVRLEKSGCDSDWGNKKSEVFINTSPTQFYYIYISLRIKTRTKPMLRKMVKKALKIYLIPKLAAITKMKYMENSAER